MRNSDTYLLDRGGAVLAGRYRITQLLGTGGMGSIWLAKQLALNTTVVVKFHEGWTGADQEEGKIAIARFLHEAKLLAAVRHRNVTELFEVGETDEGERYLIMERLVGQSLADRMRDGERFPIGDALKITLEVARGLEAVHAAGVHHRDVKPENIFLHEDEDVRAIVPKLMDFGLARTAENWTRLTDPSRTVGTPGYMAPELAYGLDNADHGVDLYALTVTFYEMLVADLPHEGETLGELLDSVTSEEAIPITDRRPEIPAPLAAFIMRGLARERALRFPDARRYALALEGVVAQLRRS